MTQKEFTIQNYLGCSIDLLGKQVLGRNIHTNLARHAHLSSPTIVAYNIFTNFTMFSNHVLCYIFSLKNCKSFQSTLSFSSKTNYQGKIVSKHIYIDKFLSII